MDHKAYREWLSLSLYNELNQEQTKLLEEHLSGCDACRSELGELRQMHSVLERKRAEVPSEHLLQEARAELRIALRKERQSRSFWQEWTSSVGAWWTDLKVSPQYAAAVAAVFTFVIGMLVGSSSLLNRPPQEIAKVNPPTPKTNIADKVPLTTGSDISNVRFIDSDSQNGEVEIAFDAVKPMTLKGNVNDPVIQRVLTYAVLKEQNPGVRLKAVNAIGAQQDQEKQSGDPKLKAALISALKFDKNAGVRKEALNILGKFPEDEEIQAALLDVLVHDENPGLRVASMKLLEAQELVDPELLNVMKGKAKTDENAFIRNRATLVTDEVKQ
jgi:HEAT repeats/Putative zinc-finger